MISFLKQEEFEDTKKVIRICKSKKNGQNNGQKKKGKRTNNDLQKYTSNYRSSNMTHYVNYHMKYPS